MLFTDAQFDFDDFQDEYARQPEPKRPTKNNDDSSSPYSGSNFNHKVSPKKNVQKPSHSASDDFFSDKGAGYSGFDDFNKFVKESLNAGISSNLQRSKHSRFKPKSSKL